MRPHGDVVFSSQWVARVSALLEAESKFNFAFSFAFLPRYIERQQIVTGLTEMVMLVSVLRFV